MTRGRETNSSRCAGAINTLVRRAYDNACVKGFHDDYPPMGLASINSTRHIMSLLALVHSEVSEAVEEVRVGNIEAKTRDDGKPLGLPSELADTVVRVFDIAGLLDIDLGAAIEEKMAYNEGRTRMHGGKLA